MRFVASGSVFLLSVFAMLASAPVSEAQTVTDPLGLTAGTLLVRGRLVGILPDGSNTTITPIGGHIDISDSVTPEVDISYFFTDHIAIEAETGFTHNSLTAENTALGDVDVGKVWSAPALATLQYHFLPRSRWNPYAGVGIVVLPFFGAQPAGGAVQQLSVQSQVGASFQVGMDVRLSGRWYGNVDIKKLIVGSYASVDDGAIVSTGNIDPLIVGLGIGYRF